MDLKGECAYFLLVLSNIAHRLMKIGPIILF